jgi:hypothetical protein
VRWTSPKKLTSMTWRKVAIEVSSMRARWLMPALLMSTSRLPRQARARTAAASMALGSLTSSGSTSRSSGRPSSASSASSRSVRRAERISTAPSRWKARASDAPMPEEAPVIQTT